MNRIAFFNDRGGVGQTSLVYHLGWTFAELGRRVLMVDLDPQSNLTAMCLEEERLEQLWVALPAQRRTIRGAIDPVMQGVGDLVEPHREHLHPRLALLPGDLLLSEFEQQAADAWPRCMDRDPAMFRIASIFHRAIEQAALQHDAELVLIDVGPNLGAINRSALIAASHVVTPLGAELFSLQGLRNLGPTLRRWRTEWAERRARAPDAALSLPDGSMRPIGYVVMQANLWGGQVTRAYERWMAEIPSTYAEAVLGVELGPSRSLEQDPNCLAVLRHYRSLMPLAQAARKPIFKLTAADGAIGAHAKAARDLWDEFRALAGRIDGAIAAAGPPEA